VIEELFEAGTRRVSWWVPKRRAAGVIEAAARIEKAIAEFTGEA